MHAHTHTSIFISFSSLIQRVVCVVFVCWQMCKLHKNYAPNYLAISHALTFSHFRAVPISIVNPSLPHFCMRYAFKFRRCCRCCSPNSLAICQCTKCLFNVLVLNGFNGFNGISRIFIVIQFIHTIFGIVCINAELVELWWLSDSKLRCFYAFDFIDYLLNELPIRSMT